MTPETVEARPSVQHSTASVTVAQLGRVSEQHEVGPSGMPSNTLSDARSLAALNRGTHARGLHRRQGRHGAALYQMEPLQQKGTLGRRRPTAKRSSVGSRRRVLQI